MDFFAHQDRARASTRKLIVVYTLCLLGVVVTLNVVAFFVFHVASRAGSEQTNARSPAAPSLSNPNDLAANISVFAFTSVSVLSIVGLATMFKQMQLGGDGAKVAELLGGRPIISATGDPAERKLMNVVEEMSLASGVPMPRVFLLDKEMGINAFAAGKRPEAAVIGVTRGCIERLNRDELQGVIAHEFSHILNGDMRLNLRLIALNFGLMAIGYIGLQILRFSPRSSSKDSKGGAAAILLFGVAMMVIGYVGTLFGKLLQAAVSRQREFLADASAVQFTRNPSGIAGALKKIGGFAKGAEVSSVHAGEMSHLFFADGVVGFLDSVFATHPPLEKRIRAIEPNWNGKLLTGRTVAGSPLEPMRPQMAGASGFAGSTSVPLPRAGERVVAPPAEIVEDAGNIEPEKLVHADTLVAAIPNQIEELARDPYDARAIAVSLLLDRSGPLRAAQMQAVNRADPNVAAIAERLYPIIAELGPAARLPILDLALPALHHLSESQLKDFRELCRVLARADQRISSFEIALFKIVDHQLLSKRKYEDVIAFRSVTSVAKPARILLSVLALTGGPEQAQRAFAAGMQRLGLEGQPMATPEESREFERSLSELCNASLPVQRRILDAAAHCVAADGAVGIEEMELMRAVSASLSVPVPPFLTVAAR